MADARSVNHQPKAAGQHADIFFGSPMAIVGLFVEVIRARFRDGNETALPWYWGDDPTPATDETGAPASATDGAPGVPDRGRKIYIESAYAHSNNARDVRPAVFVDKDHTQLLKPVIGNRAAFLPQTGTEVYYAIAVVPIEVMCLSEERGESAQIADFVWFHLLACANLIRQEYGIHDISPPIIGKTVPHRRSEGNRDTGWNTPVEFNVMIEYRWKTQPIAPLLASIRQTLATIGNGDAAAGAIAVATGVSIVSKDPVDT